MPAVCCHSNTSKYYHAYSILFLLIPILIVLTSNSVNVQIQIQQISDAKSDPTPVNRNPGFLLGPPSRPQTLDVASTRPSLRCTCRGSDSTSRSAPSRASPRSRPSPSPTSSSCPAHPHPIPIVEQGIQRTLLAPPSLDAPVGGSRKKYIEP